MSVAYIVIRSVIMDNDMAIYRCGVRTMNFASPWANIALGEMIGPYVTASPICVCAHVFHSL